MSRVSRRVLLTATILLMPIAAHAQEAVMTGTVSDSTGGVLPGVTVTALLEATGNTFVAVTDERGAYRLPVRVGVCGSPRNCKASRRRRRGIQLLVGQTLVVNLEMAPSTIEETITVNAEAPLLKVDSSSLGGNIDQEAGSGDARAGTRLGCAAPARSRQPSHERQPNRINSRNSDRIREFQANIDGQQFQNTMGGGGQPTFSQEMIAEFQFISNRFDATQGRSSGLQVNLVTKSGTNRYTGSFRSFPRRSFQRSRSGSRPRHPLSKSAVRLHIRRADPARSTAFLRVLMRREPKEETWRTPYARFNVSLEGTSRKKIGGTRIDYQLSPQTRLMFS